MITKKIKARKTKGIFDTPMNPVNPSKQPKGTIFGAQNTAKNRAMVTKMLSRNYK